MMEEMQGEQSSQNQGGNEAERPWDADDPRRRKDQMAPPMEPCECFCLHCHRSFSSEGIWLQKIHGGRDGFEGFWRCPTPNCDGAGFTFDIFPTDPNHPANEDTFYSDDEEIPWEDDDDAFFEQAEAEPESEYDPDEPYFKMLEEMEADEDDLEGEEWKYGLEPGQRLSADASADFEPAEGFDEEEKKYNEPDQRPRELDWSDRDRPEYGGGPTEDDIPF